MEERILFGAVMKSSDSQKCTYACSHNALTKLVVSQLLSIKSEINMLLIQVTPSRAIHVLLFWLSTRRWLAVLPLEHDDTCACLGLGDVNPHVCECVQLAAALAMAGHGYTDECFTFDHTDEFYIFRHTDAIFVLKRENCESA